MGKRAGWPGTGRGTELKPEPKEPGGWGDLKEKLQVWDVEWKERRLLGCREGR